MQPTSSEPAGGRSLVGLACLAFCSWLVYLAIAASSQRLHEDGAGKRPLLGLLALFGAAFALYVPAIRIAGRARQDGRLLSLIVAAAVVFRLTLLLSDPIEEVDLYRYVWDGAVTTQGVSPFRYSPQQVLAAPAEDDLPEDLARLVRLRDRSPEMTAVLKKVHFGELPTIYPPVSQAIFAVGAWTTPQNASLFVRLTLMKAWFTAFDLGTLALVIWVLRAASRPVGWSIVHAWCPLVIKEIANSGHLDALAYFLATLALALAIRLLFRAPSQRATWLTISACFALLALACGAKLYPIILLPMMVLSTHKRFGWGAAILGGLAFSATAAPLAWPMWPARAPQAASASEVLDPAHVAVLGDDVPPAPPPEFSAQPRDPSQSLRAFLGEWEMNDFLFLIVIENLRSDSGLASNEIAWFSILPERWRDGLVRPFVRLTGADAKHAPFLMTRAIMSIIFVMVAAWLALRAGPADDAAAWLELAFLTVAWFWLLLPTLNPWYWTWAIPLLPFARNRAWLALSGLVFLYYLRFWFMHRYLSDPVPGTTYSGPLFFDYVVVWLEFAPWLLWLILSNLPLRRGGNSLLSAGLRGVPANHVLR